VDEDRIKIVLPDNRVITLKEFFEETERAHKELAKLSFEDKVRILVKLQEIARDWGQKKDVLVWKI
jgi:hypothetical protein